MKVTLFTTIALGLLKTRLSGQVRPIGKARAVRDRKFGYAALAIAAAFTVTSCIATGLTKVEEQGPESGNPPLIKPFIPQNPGVDAQVGPEPVQPAMGTDAAPPELARPSEMPAPAPPEVKRITQIPPPGGTPLDSRAATPEQPRPKREVKPFNPSEAQTRMAKEEKKQAQTGPQPLPVLKQSKQGSATPVPPSKKQAWESEDHKVRKAALELAKGFPAVKAMKICLADKDDEWWLIMYEEAGAHYELLQFVWERDKLKFDQHLVQKRIPAHRMQEHLTTRERDKACEVMNPAQIQADPGQSKAGQAEPSPDGQR